MSMSGVKDRLRADAGVLALVSSANIYAGTLKERGNLPAITYFQPTSQPINTLRDGYTGYARRVITINAWAKNEQTAYNIRKAIIEAMKGYGNCFNDIPLHEDESNLYRYALDYAIRGY
ncbi:tail completion protein gp17 [Marinobacterium lutimaris]|uniref:DUF3168 domain-containing protein n=1 Tax=Marinobacterium lutimaris TaxID=568106 RepID=A0A1H5YAB9_9GAMM|nr:DUF3168 domain-containing protein [Marinobacterium lutimaris]SEG20386.1 Protein of unknown function [Marinobacterium lutimaris]